MGISSMENALRRRKVLVEFESSVHAFRLVENHTFGALLTDAAKHWMIDEDDYELHDEEGSTWPSGGTFPISHLHPLSQSSYPSVLTCHHPLFSFLVFIGDVMSMLLAEKASEDFLQSPELQVYLKPLNAFITRDSPRVSISRSLSGVTDLSGHENDSPTSHKTSTDALAIPPFAGAFLSRSFSSALHHHQRTSSKSDTVRKLIEENRLAPPIVSPSSVSIDAQDYYYQLHPPAPTSSLSSSFGALDSNPAMQAPINLSASSSAAFGSHSSSSDSPLSSSSQGISFGSSRNIQSSEGSGRNETPESRISISSSNSDLLTPSTGPNIVQTTLNGTTAIPRPELQTIGKSSPPPVFPASSATLNPTSADPTTPSKLESSRNASIRLKKAYDNLTVNETLLRGSDIQLAPTTHKDVSIEWESRPSTVLIIKKKQEPGITELLRSMADWLINDQGIRVMVEKAVHEELPELEAFGGDGKEQTEHPDLVICLGGDGTVLHANSLFQNSMPPVMAFGLGSLSFLAPFRVRKYKQSIASVLSQGCKVTLRSRLFCIVVKHDAEGREIVTKRTVLNEVVLDRGYSPYLSNLECFCDHVPITNIQADGIIISSATGSTAYSLSAGGSMLHPQVPAFLFTPICPHSLSFRPLIFPDSVELKIQVPSDSRSTAWASFDGREQTELQRGDYLIIRVSKWPFVWIRESDGVADWFRSLAECLHWNDRRKQKPVSLASLQASKDLGASTSNSHN